MSIARTWGAPILVAEDDPLIGELVMLHLTAAGHRSTLVKSGQDVMRRIFEVEPSLVVLDINLPGVSGFDILAQVRQGQRLAATPILVLTARHAPDDVRRAMALGANDYVAKPFETAKLMKRIERLLSAKPAPAPVKSPAPAKPPAPDDDHALML